MADLGQDVARLVRLAYLTANGSTREVIGVHAFHDALPGPASKIKLSTIWGQPRNLQEAVGNATEVDTMMESENKMTARRRDIRVV